MKNSNIAAMKPTMPPATPRPNADSRISYLLSLQARAGPPETSSSGPWVGVTVSHWGQAQSDLAVDRRLNERWLDGSSRHPLGTALVGVRIGGHELLPTTGGVRCQSRRSRKRFRRPLDATQAPPRRSAPALAGHAVMEFTAECRRRFELGLGGHRSDHLQAQAGLHCASLPGHELLPFLALVAWTGASAGRSARRPAPGVGR